MKARYVHREIEAELRAASGQFPVLAVTGARQTGKSTLLRTVFRDHLYLTLDDPFTRRAAHEDPRTFLAQAPRIIVDEIQHLPDLLPYIKIAVDEDRHHHGRFLLTGSQLFPLMAHVSESLAGRVALYELRPFTVAEAGLARLGSPDDAFAALFAGFYPEVVVHGVARERFYSSYVQTYLERDIRLLTAVHDVRAFQAFLELLAARVGNLLNLNEIAREAAISFTTARRWLSLLESAGLVFTLRPYARNVSKRVVKSPKLYFGDTGLVSYLLRYPDAASLRHGPHAGALFENLVLLELLKWKTNGNRNATFSFLRDSNHNEVDFVVDLGRDTLLLEAKLTATPRMEHFAGLRRLQPLFPRGRGYLLSFVRRQAPVGPALMSMSWTDLRSILALDSLYQAPPVGQSSDGRQAADHDKDLYGL